MRRLGRAHAVIRHQSRTKIAHSVRPVEQYRLDLDGKPRGQAAAKLCIKQAVKAKLRHADIGVQLVPRDLNERRDILQHF